VWHGLVAGLDGLDVAIPTAGVLSQARRSVGSTLLRFLFNLLRRTTAGVATTGVPWRRLLVTAIDGTTMSVPDSPANLTEYTTHRCHTAAPDIR
jgi:hypothetical protein